MSRLLPPVTSKGRAPGDLQGSADDGPFDALPHPRIIVTRAAIGLVTLICALAIIGAIITSSVGSGARRWDESVNSSLANDRSQQFVHVAEWFSKMADTRPILGIMALITIALALCRQWRATLLVPLAMLLEITTFLAVNYIVGRPRPDVSKIGSIPSTYSFPSGHIAATFVCWFGAALLLYVFGRYLLAQLVSAVAAAMTVFTGWARVYLGMHHTIDVAAGLAMGIAALAIAAKSLNMRVVVRDGRASTVPETVTA